MSIATIWNSPSENAAIPSMPRIGVRPDGRVGFSLSGDADVTPREFIRQVRKFKGRCIIEWEGFFHRGVIDGEPFSAATVANVISMLRAARKALARSLFNPWGMTAKEIAAILSLTDFENWGEPGSNYSRSHAALACEWFAFCLREAGWGSDYGNYATVPFDTNPLKPCAQTRAKGVNVPVLVSYGAGGSKAGCWGVVEIAANLDEASPGGATSVRRLYVHSEWNEPSSLRYAQHLGFDIIIWVDEARRIRDKGHAIATDRELARYLASAGWASR